MLSGVIANVRLARDHIVGVAGLAPAALPVQARMAETLAALVPPVETAASAVRDFAAAAPSQLDAADEAITVGDSDATRRVLESLQHSAQPTGLALASASERVTAGKASIFADNQTLADLATALSTQLTHDDAEADAAREAVDSLERNKYYWLLLGPLGLPGLAVCIGMIVDATNRANGIQRHISELRAQSTQLTKMCADLRLLQQEVPTLATLIQSLQNALGFLGGDIGEVVADVGRSTTPSTIARAYVVAARHQVSTLMADAS